MDLHVLVVVHALPLWFLVFSLFLPRVALLLLWIQVLFLIYLDQGISLWFILHLVAALMVWGGSGSYHARRRRN
jgi:hypothetical protein